ncbi:MAG: hypothetical protein MJ078_06945, partial [Clostridia bacterium]|nr:hypothetical protein [Clostridia bacterium]
MMITSLSIALLSCLIMILCVLFNPTFRFGKITLDSYWVVIFLGACAMMLSGQIDFGSLGKALTDASAVNPVKILILFISMTVLSVFLDEVGFFGYLAVKALSLAGKSQVKLFTVLYLTVSVLTVFTSNDIIVLTFTPFICYFAKRADIDPKPYLFAEFIAANTMSMMLIIGNPTNIYIATSYSIAFIDYFLVMALPTLASSVTAYIILLLLFRKSLACPMDAKPQTAHIENKLFLGIGVAILSLCT